MIHRIRRQIIELDLDQEQGADTVQRRAASVLQDKVLPELDRWFSQIAPEDRVLRLDRLEVDLGDLGDHNWEQRFAERCVERITRQISEVACAAAPQEAETVLRLDPVQNAWQVMGFYLEYGVMPWYAQGMSLGEIIAALRNDVPNLPLKLRHLLRESQLAQRRLARQFSLDFAGAVTEKILGLEAGWVSRALQVRQSQAGRVVRQEEGAMFVENLAAMGVDAVANLLPEPALVAWLFEPAPAPARHLARQDTLLAANEEESANAEAPSDVLLKPPSITGKDKPAWHEDLARQAPGGASEARYGFLQDEKTPEGKKDKRVDGTLKPSDTGKSKPAWQEGLPCLAPENSSEARYGFLQDEKTPEEKKDQRTPMTPQELPPQAPDDSSSVASSPVAAQERYENDPDEKIGTQPRQRRPVPGIQEGLWVENAGLVLLAPYLPAFFERLGIQLGRIEAIHRAAEDAVLEDSEFLRALHLLHYLATGEEAPEEPQLALPKLLCGLPVECLVLPGPDGVPSGLSPAPDALSETDRTEADAMLSAVIRNWSILKNTSIQGLQNGFLKRSGQIRWQDGRHAWLLQIERQSMDILLDRLPWGYSVIKLPWMQEMIQVEW